MQLCTDRGFFYVWADKVGTQRESDGRPCFEGNHVMAPQEYTLQFHRGQSQTLPGPVMAIHVMGDLRLLSSFGS